MVSNLDNIDYDKDAKNNSKNTPAQNSTGL